MKTPFGGEPVFYMNTLNDKKTGKKIPGKEGIYSQKGGVKPRNGR